MISLGSGQKSLLATGVLVRRLFLTLEITDDDGENPETIGFWDGLEDRDLGTAWPLFRAFGGQPELSSLQQVLDGSIPGATLTVSGVPETPLADLIVDESVRWAQRPATIWLGLYNASTKALVGSLIPLFRGYFDKATFIDGRVGEESKLQIALESAAREMTRTNPTVRSDLDQRARFSGDEGMEFVGRDYALEWGIEQKKRRNRHRGGKHRRGRR